MTSSEEKSKFHLGVLSHVNNSNLVKVLTVSGLMDRRRIMRLRGWVIFWTLLREFMIVGLEDFLVLILLQKITLITLLINLQVIHLYGQKIWMAENLIFHG